jgi:hypothetical protein
MYWAITEVGVIDPPVGRTRAWLASRCGRSQQSEPMMRRRPLVELRIGSHGRERIDEAMDRRVVRLVQLANRGPPSLGVLPLRSPAKSPAGADLIIAPRWAGAPANTIDPGADSSISSTVTSRGPV